jgi:hypothetical protein
MVHVPLAMRAEQVTVAWYRGESVKHDAQVGEQKSP